MLGLFARIAIALAVVACLSAGGLASAAGGPTGQFLPSVGDRDGDGLPDAADCAPDDPSRPGRAGVDADCDGAPDAGLPVIEIAGPADGGPDPAEQQAASKPSSGTVAAKSAARRAAGQDVVVVRGLRLGPSVAVYAPKRPSRATPTVVLVAKGNSGVTVRPHLVFAGGRTRALAARTRSVARGRAFVVRLQLSKSQRRAQRLRFAMTVVDGSGDSYRAARTVPVSAR